MNYHTDEWIMNKVKEHYNEACNYFAPKQILGLFYQGSGNYGLDYEGSDVDTKLIVLPTLREVALNKQPVSTTHVRANDEHIDFKDVRLYIQTFKKQNLNFLEILFTKYKIINPQYEDLWNKLIEIREKITHYSPVQGIKSMRGIAKEKYFAMEHHYPTRMDWINKYGYDPKQLHHLIRVEEFIEQFITGKDYEDCLQTKQPEYLIEVKKGYHTLGEARIKADNAINHIDKMCDEYLTRQISTVDIEVEKSMEDIQYQIIEKAIRDEIQEKLLSTQD